MATKLLGQLGRLHQTIARNGAPAADCERFARTYIEVLAAQARSATTVRKLANGEVVGPDSSIDKLLFSRAEKDVSDLIFDLQRHWLLIGENGEGAAELDTTRAEWWYSRAATIMGGTVEIQRGIVADHILGLPREVRA